MFQFCCYIFHFVFCKRIHADEHHTQDSTYGRQEAQEHLDTANRFFTLHCVCLEAKESEQPTGYRRTDSPTKFLAHGRRGEYQSCGTVTGFQFRIVGAIGIHRPEQRKDTARTNAD